MRMDFRRVMMMMMLMAMMTPTTTMALLRRAEQRNPSAFDLLLKFLSSYGMVGARHVNRLWNTLS
jgi:hypothetical protein